MHTSKPYEGEFNLLQAFSQGEKAAFTAIYKSYHLPIYRFAQKYLPHEADAEDLAADSFVKLWNRRSDFNSLEHIRAFLFTTVKNSCLDFIKHQQMKTGKHAELLQRLTEAGPRQFALQEIRTELLKMVYAEVQKLPPKMREVFLLSYKEGLKPAEIAEKLSLSVQTVHNQKQNAIRVLRQALGNETLLLALLLCLDLSATGLPPGAA